MASQEIQKPVENKKTPIQMVQGFFKNLKLLPQRLVKQKKQVGETSPQNVASQAQSQQVQQPLQNPTDRGATQAVKKRFPKKKILVILGGVVGVLLVLLLLVTILGRMNGSGNGLINPTPTPTPVETPDLPEISNPSQYSEDEDVLSIIDDLDSLDEELSKTDFREDTIRVPLLDWDVEFD